MNASSTIRTTADSFVALKNLKNFEDYIIKLKHLKLSKQIINILLKL